MEKTVEFGLTKQIHEVLLPYKEHYVAIKEIFEQQGIIFLKEMK